MGILPQGIHGPMINKTGAVIGRMQKGQNIIVGLYKKRTSKRVMTSNQTSSNNRLGLLSSFLSDISDFVNEGFKKMVKHNSPVNAALSYNYDHAFIESDGISVLNYPKMVYSIGDVEPPESPKIECLDGLMELSWFDMPQSKFCQYADRASVLIYDPVEHQCVAFQNMCSRSDLSVLLDVSTLIGTLVHCYVCFTSADGKKQGNSLYLGLVQV